MAGELNTHGLSGVHAFMDIGMGDIAAGIPIPFALQMSALLKERPGSGRGIQFVPNVLVYLFCFPSS